MQEQDNNLLIEGDVCGIYKIIHKEIVEYVEAYLCILIAFMFWRFNFMFRMISSGSISLPWDRNGSFISTTWFSLRRYEFY